MLTYEYDDLDQVIRITYPDTKYVDINYASWSPRLITSVKDRAGFTTSYTYDANKRLISVTGPDGMVRYEYDGNGNMTALIDQDQKVTQFEYDLDNRLKKKIFYDDKFVAYEYDEAGLLNKFTNARGIQKNYTLYDANHNLSTVAYSNTTPDTATPGVSFTYDDFNRLITMTTVGKNPYTYTYHDEDKLETIDGPWNNDLITFNYNKLGQLKGIIMILDNSTMSTITYKYDYENTDPNDNIGRLEAIQTASGNFTYDYTGINPLIQSLTRPNGSVTEYSYIDALKRLTDIVNKDSSLQTINAGAFTYDGRDLIDTETITYAPSITPLTPGVKVYSNNIVNQLTSITNPNQSFTYDNDGNMTQGYNPDNKVMTMTYDAENRLTSAQYTDGGGVLRKTEYSYSGNNMLETIEKYVNGNPVTETNFVRAGFLPLQERNGSNQVSREYTWGLNSGGGIGGLLGMKQGSQNYYYLYDGKGNVSAVIDSSSTVAASYRYDAFGNLISDPASALDQPFRFSTKRYDTDTGLYYYGYRYYSPLMGKWITRDPIGEDGGINLYGFVGNSPMNWVDLLGLEYLRRPNSRYVVGRLDSYMPPGGHIGSYLEDHVTHMNQTGIIHDFCVNTLHDIGVPDILANYPTMIPAYGTAVIYNNLTDYSQPQQDHIILYKLNW